MSKQREVKREDEEIGRCRPELDATLFSSSPFIPFGSFNVHQDRSLARQKKIQVQRMEPRSASSNVGHVGGLVKREQASQPEVASGNETRRERSEKLTMIVRVALHNESSQIKRQGCSS